MEEFVQTSALDNGLINEIVCKVKSEGLFDQFRRECLADVDTKPAYQNLQNRVESAVCSFLEDQDWHSQLNKNQLREKLRKLVLEKKFFDAGIERIVDQVINPKLNANFVPKIEEIAYKFMGVERPEAIFMNDLKIEIETDIPPVYGLEQVSPVENYEVFDYFDAKTDDLESPAFEPIEMKSSNNDDDMDISDGSDTPRISGLTSNESNNSSNDFVGTSFKNMTEKSLENDVRLVEEKMVNATVFTSDSNDIALDQDSELSQVSSENSTSRLSIVTNNITNSNEGYKGDIETIDACANADCLYGISEEAQMQKFNESSSSTDSSTKTSTKEFLKTQFNIENEKIKFEGTERLNLDLIDFEEKERNSKKSQSLSRSSKKDDHFTHKGKGTTRQRSHSKDSNDGYTFPNKMNYSDTQNINQSKSSNEQAYTQYANETAYAEPTEAAVAEPLLSNNITSQPVVIDQILIGNDLDLQSFINENRADPVVSSIEEEIMSVAKKPKVAFSVSEAKKLTKVRKQIELKQIKKIEQATVRAKQYIRTNVTIRDEQGVELEFVCRDSQASSSTASCLEKSIENELSIFKGFDFMEKDQAVKTFENVNKHFMQSNISTSSEIVLANVFISDDCKQKHRQKVRYSNEELFKPRPLLCGISKRRRESFVRNKP